MKSFVWAIDEDGKPCKCFAKQENRGKGRCPHKFHAQENEDFKSFYQKFNVSVTSESDVPNSEVLPKEEHFYTTEDLPDYSEMIKNVISPVDTSGKESFIPTIRSIIKDPPFDGDFKSSYFVGMDIKIEEEVSPDDPYNTIIKMSFVEENGETFDRQFKIPRMNESGEFVINGTKFRYIPTIREDKMGISLTDRVAAFKDENENTFMLINRGEEDKRTIVTTTAKGEKRKTTAVAEEIQKYLDGDETAKLTNPQKEALKRFSPDTLKRLVENSSCILTTFDPKKGNLREKTVARIEDIQKYLDGDETSKLTDLQKEALNHLSPYAKEMLEKSSLREILARPSDDPNDLSNRGVVEYKERVGFVISKTFGGISSNRSKGKPCKFNLDKLTKDIKKELVAGSYMQLSDNINPIAAMSQSQRLSFVGIDGVDKDKVPEKLRRVHKSFYGLIDTADVSLGGKIGTSASLKGHIKNRQLLKDENVLTGSDFVPYKEYNDPNRTAMAVGQMKEACPIIGGEDPIVSTKGWDKIKGAKLGLNLNTAYIAGKGVWEDAVVISESAAKKMTTVQTSRYLFDEKPRGLKVGQRVHRGERVGSTVFKYPGVVKSIDEKNTVFVETEYKMGVGDKLAGRAGNKGVVSRVLPDNEMPIDEHGNRVDLILSPIGVAGRSNLGQVYEVNGGVLNKKTGVSWEGKKVQATAGNMFVFRINQIAEKKMLSNSNNLTHDKEFKSRFGEMENILLSSNQDRLDILNYIKHQETSDVSNKFRSTLHSVGIDFVGLDAPSQKPIKI